MDARALVHEAFTMLGAERVVATTMTVNTGSRRVLERAGLSLVRTFCLDWLGYLEGAEHGDVEYAVDRLTASPASPGGPCRGCSA